MGKKAVSRLCYYLSVTLTLLLSTFTLAGAFAIFVIPETSMLITFLGLALPILLLINIAAAIYWAIRWRYWVWLPLLAIAGNAFYLNGIWQPGTTNTKPIEGTITIVTYNVNSFNKETSGHTCKEIAAYLKRQQADIICFQELGINSTFTADSIKAAMNEWPYSYIPQATDSLSLLRLAVFSKFPIGERELITYPNSRNSSLWCNIDINGKTFRLFNNHLQTTQASANKLHLAKAMHRQLPEEEKYEEVKYAGIHLLDELYHNFLKRSIQANVVKQCINESPYPVLVCGDFNSLPSSYSYYTVKGKQLKDGFKECGHGYMYTYRYFRHLLRIDYILYSNEVEGVSYFSPKLMFSDHNPVVIRVRL